jgi:capsular exopolysaccharide synthesis family protein
VEDPDEAVAERSLMDYASVVLRRRRLVIAVVVVVLAVVTLMTVRTPESYSASSTVRLTSARSLSADASSGEVDDIELETELAALESSALDDRVQEVMGARFAEIGDVGFSGIKDTRVLRVSASSRSRAVARDAANTYATEYIAQRVEAADELVEELRKKIQPDITAFTSQITELDSQILQQANAGNDAAVVQLQQRRSELSDQRQQLQSTLTDVQLQASLRRGGGAEVLSAAALPGGPSSPKPVQNATLGILLGLMLGVGAAFVRESVVDVIEDSDEMNRVLSSITVLGSVPNSSILHNDPLPVAFTAPASTAAEAMRSIRTSIDFIALEKQLDVVLVTSANKGEGKSTVAANLAGAITIAGAHVILVSADLRNPEIDNRFRLLGRPGLSNVLLGETTLDAALLEFAPPDSPGRLQVLPIGSIPPNPSELLVSDRFTAVLRALRERCDLVILDSSPLLPVTDARLLARHADVAVLVSRVGVSRRRNVLAARQLLEAAGSELVTAVINGAQPLAGGYGYGVVHERPSRWSRRRKRSSAALDRVSTLPRRVPDAPESRPASGAR